MRENNCSSLVDLGEENDRNLKMPSEIAAEKAASDGQELVETAAKTTTQMAEQAGEKPAKVNKSTCEGKREFRSVAMKHILNY